MPICAAVKFRQTVTRLDLKSPFTNGLSEESLMPADFVDVINIPGVSGHLATVDFADAN